MCVDDTGTGPDAGEKDVNGTGANDDDDDDDDNDDDATLADASTPTGMGGAVAIADRCEGPAPLRAYGWRCGRDARLVLSK